MKKTSALKEIKRRIKKDERMIKGVNLRYARFIIDRFFGN